MLDFFNITTQKEGLLVYYADRATNSWQTWIKPRACRQVWMACIGAGSSGYSSSASLTSTAQGGATGAITCALYDADILPNTLYVKPGLGGLPNPNPGGYNPGTKSWVSLAAVDPSLNPTVNIVCQSGTGTSVLVSADGTKPETSLTLSSAPLMLRQSLWSSRDGVGPPSAAVNDATPLSGSILCPGACGGSISGVNITGGSILSVDLITFNTAAIPDAATKGDGSDGMWFWSPMPYGLGGSGGRPEGSGVGSLTGGAGAYGCGGGGGGGYYTAPANVGGKGGDGLVIILSI